MDFPSPTSYNYGQDFPNHHIFFFFYLYIYGCIGSLLLRMGFSLVAASGGYSSLRCVGFSLQCLLLLWSTGSRGAGFSSCGTRAQELWLAGFRAQAQELWLTGLAAPRHVGSSRSRARTRVPCIGRRILNHCVTREAPQSFSKEAGLLEFCSELTDFPICGTSAENKQFSNMPLS